MHCTISRFTLIGQHISSEFSYRTDAYQSTSLYGGRQSGSRGARSHHPSRASVYLHPSRHQTKQLNALLRLSHGRGSKILDHRDR